MPDQGRPVPSLWGAARSSTQTATARGRPAIGSPGPVCASGAGGSSAPSAAFASLAFAAAPAVAQAPDSETWVGLAGGRMGDVLWSVKVARPPGSAERPCLQVGTKRERGRFDYERSKYQGCVERSSRLAATESPLIVTGAQASAGMQVSLTAVGMVCLARRPPDPGDLRRREAGDHPAASAEPEPGSMKPAWPTSGTPRSPSPAPGRSSGWSP